MIEEIIIEEIIEDLIKESGKSELGMTCSF